MRTQVALVLLLLSACSAYQSRTSGIDIAEARRLVDQSVKEGYITEWTCTGNTARVAPAFWRSIDARTKEGVVLALARICVAENSGDRMSIYDAMSGKQLAKYTGQPFRSTDSKLAYSGMEP